MRHEADFLSDIIDYAGEIEGLVDGIQLADFVQNDLLRSTVTYKLLIIGEAASRISQESRNRFSDVPWTQIVGFRNQVAHGYFATDYSVVFSVATIQLPDLRRRVTEIAQILSDE